MPEQTPATPARPTKPAQHLAIVLVAAGSGSRLGGEVPKQFQDFMGQPMFIHSLRSLQEAALAEHFVIVVPAGWEEKVQQQARTAAIQADVVVAGGETRQQSVRIGIETILKEDWSVTHVLVHDAARPFVSTEMVLSVVAAVHETGAATLALPVSDTLMRAADATAATNRQPTQADELVDRSGLWAIQTPQVFDLQLLLRAHAQAADSMQATDDGSLILDLGVKLHFVRGSWWNIKVTHAEDFEKARLIATMRRLPATEFSDETTGEQRGEA